VGALYEIGVSTASPSVLDNAYVALWNTAGSRRIVVREIGLTHHVAGNATNLSLARISARGTATTSTSGERQDPGDVGGTTFGQVDTAWSVQPTKSGNYLRRYNGRAAIAGSVFWQWWVGPGLIVPAGAGVAVLLAVAIASNLHEAYVIWEE